jgi:hypothetical protein
MSKTDDEFQRESRNSWLDLAKLPRVGFGIRYHAA